MNYLAHSSPSVRFDWGFAHSYAVNTQWPTGSHCLLTVFKGTQRRTNMDFLPQFGLKLSRKVKLQEYSNVFSSKMLFEVHSAASSLWPPNQSVQAHTQSCHHVVFLHQFSTGLQKCILSWVSLQLFRTGYKIFINRSSSDLLSFLRSSGLQALPVPCRQLQHGVTGGWERASLCRGSWGCVCSQRLGHLSQLCPCCECVLFPCWCVFCASASNSSIL